MKRVPLKSKSQNGGGSFFSAPSTSKVFTSGCPILDCVLGGGWAEGRIANIVGDKSTGKTLLAIEACANFAKKYEHGSIFYAEAEAAFDIPYAEALGLPVNRVSFVDGMYTVEDVFEHMSMCLEAVGDKPSLYVLDSLDALSDRAELNRNLDEPTYGGDKAKKLSQLFRRKIRPLSDSNMTVLIISQVRDNIGVTFGKKTKRSGGRALDFYASQVLYLAHLGMLKNTRQGVQRVTGVKVKAKCEKNKIKMPFRDCEFPILFGYGIDDVSSGIAFLKQIKKLNLLTADERKLAERFGKRSQVDPKALRKLRRKLRKVVVREWVRVEQKFELKGITKY